MHVSYFCCEHVATQNQDDFIKVSLMLYVMSFASAIDKGPFINCNFFMAQLKNGFKKKSHNTANLNFPSQELRIMLLFWFL